MNLNPLFFNKITGEPEQLFIGQQKNGSEPHLFSDIIKVTEEELKDDNLKNVGLQFDKILANLNEIDIDTSVDDAVIEKLKFLFNNPELKDFKIDDDLYNLENAKISNSSIIFDRQSLELVLKKIKSIYKDQVDSTNKDKADFEGLQSKPEVDAEKDFVFENTLNTDVVLNALINHESIKFTFKSDDNKITFLISELKNLGKELNVDITNLNVESPGTDEVIPSTEDRTAQIIFNTAEIEHPQQVNINEEKTGQSKQVGELSSSESTLTNDTKIFHVEINYSESSGKQKEPITVSSPFRLDENTSEQIEKFLSNYSSNRNIIKNNNSLENSNPVYVGDETVDDTKLSSEESSINEHKKAGKIFYINSDAEPKSTGLMNGNVELNSENVMDTESPGKVSMLDKEGSITTGKNQNAESDTIITHRQDFSETKSKGESTPDKSKVNANTLHDLELEKPVLNRQNTYQEKTIIQQEIRNWEKTDNAINKTDIENKPAINETPRFNDNAAQQIAAQTSLKEFIAKDKINFNTKSESSSGIKNKEKKGRKIDVEETVKNLNRESEETKIKIISEESINKKSKDDIDNNSSKLIDKTKAVVKESITHEKELGDHSSNTNEIQSAESKIKVSTLKESLKTVNNESSFNNELKSFSATAVKTKIIGDVSSFNDNIKIISANEVVTEITKYLQTNEKQSITFQLSPENLGKIKLMVDMVDSQLHANIEVENEQVRQIVQTNLDQLKNNLQSSGIQLANVNVSLGNYEQRSARNQAARKKNFVNDNDLQIEKDANSPKKKLGYNTYEFLA